MSENPFSRKYPEGIGVNDSAAEYQAPWWLPGGHLQTIYARWLARSYAVAYRRERWDTPDRDFIDLDWVAEGEPATAKLGGPGQSICWAIWSVQLAE